MTTPAGRAPDRDTIVFVSAQGALGGSTRSLATVLASLPSGVQRVLFAPRRGRFVELVRDRGLADQHVPIPATRRFHRAGRAASAVPLAIWVVRHRRRIAAIHANGLRDLNLAAPAAIAARVPVVVWIHQFAASSWIRRLVPVWTRLLPDLRLAAVSRTAARAAAGSDASGVAIVPNPIDPADVAADVAADGAAEVAARRAPADGIVRVGYLGSTGRRKGFWMLPAIVDALRDAPVRLLVFAGPETDDATWRSLRGAPAGRVVVHGKLEDVRLAYAQCDIVLIPSLEESFCRVAAEAMCNGIPVAGSDIEPLRDLVGDEAGVLFTPGDVRAAADAVRLLVADEELRRSLGGAGRLRAAAFTPQAVVPKLLSLYSGEPAARSG